MIAQAIPQKGSHMHDINWYDLDPTQVRQIQLDLDQLSQQGLLVRVEVTGIHQFRRRASWEIFGVSPKDVRRAHVTQGMIACWPIQTVKLLESLEEQVRTHLLRYSHDLPYFSPWRYIRRGSGSREEPAHSPFWTWRIDFEALAEKLAALVATMTEPVVYAAARAEYDDHIQQMAAEAWPAMLHRLHWLALLDPTTEIPDEATWIAAQVAKAVDRFPTVAQIQQTVQARALYQRIANPLELEALATRIAQERADQAELAAFARAAATREEIEREAIEQEILNSTVLQLLDLGEPLTQVLNESTADLCAAALDTAALLANGGRFQHSSKEKVRGWLPRYRLMAGARDPLIEAAIEDCVTALPPDGDRTTAPLAVALQHLIAVTAPAVQALAAIRPEIWQPIADRMHAMEVTQ